MLSLCNRFLVAGALGELQDAVEPGACAFEFSLSPPHSRRSEQRSRFGSHWETWHFQNLLIPPGFGHAPGSAKILQPHRDVRRPAGPASVNEPRKCAAVIFQIVTHAINHSP